MLYDEITEKENNYIIIGLILAIIVTTIISISTSSKYVDVLPEVSGEAPIAKWEVFINSDPNKNINLIAGNTTQSYTVKVYSGSETAVIYSIELHDIPNYVLVSLDGGTPVAPTNNELSFENIGTIYTNDTSAHEHILTFSSSIDGDEITNKDLDLDVKFIQVSV